MVDSILGQIFSCCKYYSSVYSSGYNSIYNLLRGIILLQNTGFT